MAGLIACGDLLEARQLDTEDETVLQALLAQALRQYSVHEETELGFDLTNGFVHRVDPLCPLGISPSMGRASGLFFGEMLCYMFCFKM